MKRSESNRPHSRTCCHPRVPWRLGESCSGCLHPIDDEAGTRPIPTVSYVSFWAGLAMAVRLVREAIGHPYPRGRQQLWLTPLRMEEPHAAIWSPVAARRDCPVQCMASQSLREGREVAA